MPHRNAPLVRLFVMMSLWVCFPSRTRLLSCSALLLLVVWRRRIIVIASRLTFIPGWSEVIVESCFPFIYVFCLIIFIFFFGGVNSFFFSFSVLFVYTFLVVWLAVSKMFESNWWFLFLFFLFSETSFAFGFVSHCKHVSKGVHMSFFNICMYVCRHRTPRSEWRATDICIYKYFFPLSRIRGFTQYLEWILTLGVEHSSR